MKNLFLAVIFVLVCFLQLSILGKLSFFSFTPDLLLAAAVGYGASRQAQKNHFLILIPALIFDLMAGFPFGVLTFSLWSAYFLTDVLGRSIFKQGDFPGMLAPIALGIIFFHLIMAGLSELASLFHLAPFSLDGAYFYWFIPASAVFNGLLAWGWAIFFEKFMPESKKIVL